jgi:hypothetical protein
MYSYSRFIHECSLQYSQIPSARANRREIGSSQNRHTPEFTRFVLPWSIGKLVQQPVLLVLSLPRVQDEFMFLGESSGVDCQQRREEAQESKRKGESRINECLCG